MNKRGQGLPLNTIIIAVVVLIVLVILIVIFTGRIGLFGQGLDECSAGPTACKHTAGECNDGEVAIPQNCLPDDNIDYCCTTIG